MWPSTCLGDVSPVLRRPAFVSPRVASVRLHLLSPCRLVRSKHIQKKMLRSTAPCYVHTKLLMIRQTRTINGLSLCSCLLKEQVQERLNSPDLQSDVVLRNLRCMATHVSGGVYIYINHLHSHLRSPIQQSSHKSSCPPVFLFTHSVACVFVPRNTFWYALSGERHRGLLRYHQFCSEHPNPMTAPPPPPPPKKKNLHSFRLFCSGVPVRTRRQCVANLRTAPESPEWMFRNT